MPCQCYTRGPLSKLERTPPHAKINVTSKSPVGDISVVTLIRTDTTLDHSQKAEKVYRASRPGGDANFLKVYARFSQHKWYGDMRICGVTVTIVGSGLTTS